MAAGVDEPKAQPPRDLVAEVATCLLFVCELVLFGLAGSLAGVALVVAYKLAPGTQEKFIVDLAAKEAVVLVSQHRPGPKAYSVLVYNAWLLLYAPMVLTPCMFALAVKSTATQVAAMIASTSAGLACLCYVVVAPGVPRIFQILFIQAPYVALVPTLALFYPRKSRLWTRGVLMVVACAAGQSLTLAVASIATKDKQLLLTCVLIPIARELGVVPMRLLARALDSMDPETTGVRVRKSLTWGFALVFQISFAIASRLLTAAIDGPAKALSIMLQAVIEITSRLTMGKRDKILARAFHLQAHSRSATRPAASANYRSGKASAKFKRSLTDANMINAEMLGEYVAIIFQMACLLVLRDTPNALSIQAYAGVKPPFTELLPVSGILTGTIGMLVAEIAVDTICSVVEHRQAGQGGLNLPRAWRSISLAPKILMIAMAAFAGSALAILGMLGSRNTGECVERNICLCASGHGLRDNTFDTTYCSALYPPTGRPGGVHIYFALETPSRIEWPRRRLDKELLTNDGSFPLPLHLLGDMEVDLSSSGDDLTSATRALIGTYTSSETPTLAVAVSERAAPGGSLSGRPCDGETLSVLALPSLNGTALRAQVSLWLNLSACDLDDCEAWTLSNWECDRSSPQPIFGSDNNLP